jgi:hypothetical protein
MRAVDTVGGKGLPVELWDEIYGNLGPGDKFHLAQTCRFHYTFHFLKPFVLVHKKNFYNLERDIKIWLFLLHLW